MNREQKEVKLRMILQDYHRRNDYELQQAVNDFLALDPLPPAEGAEVTLPTDKDIAIEIVARFMANPHPNQRANYEREKKAFANGAIYMRELAQRFATLHAQRIAEKMVSERLRAMTERCKKLEFMIENGLGWEDMRNDITMPHEL